MFCVFVSKIPRASKNTEGKTKAPGASKNTEGKTKTPKAKPGEDAMGVQHRRG